MLASAPYTAPRHPVAPPQLQLRDRAHAIFHTFYWDPYAWAFPQPRAAVFLACVVLGGPDVHLPRHGEGT